MHRHTLRAALWGIVLCCGARGASAQSVDDDTRAAARAVGTSGVEAYQAQDFKTASDKLDRAYRVLRAPSLGLWSARALVKLGQLVAGGERYLDVTRLPIAGGDEAIQKQAQSDAQAELDALSPRIPSLLVQVAGVDPSSVEVSIDGKPLAAALIGEARPIDPGKHRVIGVVGSERHEEEVAIAESERKELVLSFAPQPTAPAVNVPAAPAGNGPAALAASTPAAAPADSPTAQPAAGSGKSLRTIGLIVGATGLAGIGVGSYFGLHAKSLNAASNQDGHCDADQCDATGGARRDDAKSSALVATITMLAGGALAATGATLFIVGSSKREAASAARVDAWPALGPNGAGLYMRGQF